MRTGDQIVKDLRKAQSDLQKAQQTVEQFKTELNELFEFVKSNIEINGSLA